ncbi:MAG: hypothetical protein FI734_02380 [SAR202 cluster bacterium]|nr:hypothetical protein [SAR202 cluster bacterium]|tara:strand:- start:3869 stop:4852 length:984 start_codon:yes stop_codon:yes gene_type:complete
MVQFSGMAGTFVLSLDTELGWGTVDKYNPTKYARHLEGTRAAITRLLGLFDTYEIPVTWAMVGHLFLRECHSIEGFDPHPDVQTGRKLSNGLHWHSADPATNRSTDPFWYGDDILKEITEAKPKHEIGCHTFSHLPFDHPEVDEAVIASQLGKCHELASLEKINLRSFVYPRNRVKYEKILGEHGFISYRGLQQNWYSILPSPFNKALSFGERILSITPPVYPLNSLDTNNGLVNIPASMYLMPPDGIRRLIPGSFRVRQAIKGINKAAKSESIFHLWFHPWNAGGTPVIEAWLEGILQRVTELRLQGNFRAMTMEQVAIERLGGDS